MFDFHEKRKIRQLIYSKVSIGVLFLIGILIAHSAYERFTVEREMAFKRDEKARELELLKERASVLESKIEHLENERGIEEELRSRFDVVKEGEQVVIILDEKEVAVKKQGELMEPQSEIIPLAKKPWWSFLSVLKF